MSAAALAGNVHHMDATNSSLGRWRTACGQDARIVTAHCAQIAVVTCAMCRLAFYRSDADRARNEGLGCPADDDTPNFTQQLEEVSP